jgi:hypothetical protein
MAQKAGPGKLVDDRPRQAAFPVLAAHAAGQRLRERDPLENDESQVVSLGLKTATIENVTHHAFEDNRGTRAEQVTFAWERGTVRER